MHGNLNSPHGLEVFRPFPSFLAAPAEPGLDLSETGLIRIACGDRHHGFRISPGQLNSFVLFLVKTRSHSIDRPGNRATHGDGVQTYRLQYHYI